MKSPVQPALLPTHFAHAVIGAPPWPPPVAGPDAVCWLCGGPTHGAGWRWADAVQPTFTNHTLARAPASQTLCQPCAYFASGDAYRQYAAAHPERGLKTGHATGWRSYSHLFSRDGHETPTRPRWRAVLLAPPDPPFLACISTSGQKHTIFKGRVSTSAAQCWVLLEEELLLVDTAAVRRVLATVEALLALGFRRDDIARGTYNPAQIHRAGLANWEPLERAMQQHRRRQGPIVPLACYVARREERA